MPGFWSQKMIPTRSLGPFFDTTAAFFVSVMVAPPAISSADPG
jgi:hypothetical protein